MGLAAIIFLAGLGIGNGSIKIGSKNDTETANKSLPADLDYSSIEEVYDQLKANYDGSIKLEDVLDDLKAGLAKSSNDPYTEYFNKQAAEEFNQDLDGQFTGIGAELSLGNNKEIVIISPIAGYPADKAGLRPKDVIIEIDGQSTSDMTVSEAVNKIRGEKGTAVKLKIVRDSQKTLDFEITRDTITIPSVKSEIKGSVGYLQISRFGDDTASLAQQAVTNFKTNNVKGIVLDLRGDPGGLLNAAVDVSSLWLDKGRVVLDEKRDGKSVHTYNATGDSLAMGIPTVVLVNGGSASASEITAGALKDNNAATIMGEKSYGKGSVQQLLDLRGGGLLKVTVARWYTPAGKNIDKEGITPDTEVKRSDEDITAGRDPQLDAALAKLQ